MWNLKPLSTKFIFIFSASDSTRFSGVNWFLRKMIQMASITKIFKKSEDQANRYTAINLSSKGNTEYKNWAINESFEDKGLDGTKHKVC